MDEKIDNFEYVLKSLYDGEKHRADRCEAAMRAANVRVDDLVTHCRAERARAIEDVANWVSSAMASGMFGSDSWSLRKRLAEVIRSREWETTLANEEMP